MSGIWVLLIDVSGSMEQPLGGSSRLAAAISALRNEIARLPNENIAIIQFHSEPKVIFQGRTSQQNTIKERLDKLRPSGSTDIARALYFVSKNYRRYTAVNILLISDGESSVDQAVRAARDCELHLKNLRIGVVLIDNTSTGKRLADSISSERRGYTPTTPKSFQDAIRDERSAAFRQLSASSTTYSAKEFRVGIKKVLLLVSLGLLAFLMLFLLLWQVNPPIDYNLPIAVNPSPTPPPTATPQTIPEAALSHAVIYSEIQTNGTKETFAEVSLNSLGLGEIVVTYPTEMDFQNSQSVVLEIIPSATISNTQIVSSTLNKPPPIPFGNIEIYPIMAAGLNGPNFQISPDNEIEKYVVSNRSTQWAWTINPTKTGLQALIIQISVPVVIDGREETVSTPLKNIPIDIQVTKSLSTRIVDWMPTVGVSIIGAAVAIGVAVLGMIRQSKEKNEKIKEIEQQLQLEIKKRDDENKLYEDQLATLREEHKQQSEQLAKTLQNLTRQIEQTTNDQHELDQHTKEKLDFLMFAKHDDQEKRLREMKNILDDIQETRSQHEVESSIETLKQEIEKVKQQQAEEKATFQQRVNELEAKLIVNPSQEELELERQISQIQQ